MRDGQRHIYCGTFRSLEEHLYRHLAQISGRVEPLAPIAVVVPNDLLRLHLRRSFARRTGGHANVHLLTLHSLATRVSARRVAAERLLPERPLALRLGLAHALEKDGSGLGYFARAATQEGFHRALLATIQDLTDAGITPAMLDEAASWLRSTGTHSFLATKLSEILVLWRLVERIRRRHRIYDARRDTLRFAAEEARRSPLLSSLASFIVYGFYDFTGLQKTFLRACFDVAGGTIYFPYLPQPAFEYARPGLAWLESCGFARTDLPHGGSQQTALHRLQANLFSGRVAPGAAVEGGDDLLIISAPGEARETEEVLREVIHGAPRDEAGHPPSVGILLRSAEPYLTLLHEAIGGLQTSSRRPLGSFHPAPSLARTRSGRTLILLVALLSAGFRRADVMDFLLAADLRPLENVPNPPPTALWNQMSIAAGIVEGKAEWLDRLGALADECDAQEKPSAQAVSPRQRHRRPWTKADVIEFRNFIARFFADLEEAVQLTTWRALAESVSNLYRRLVRDDPDTEQVLSALAGLSVLDDLAGPPSPSRFRRALEEALGEPQRERERFGRAEPTVADLMEARGVPFDVVIVPGLVEQLFPRPTRSDPILLDDERRRLSEILRGRGHDVDLPQKARRHAEERLLFTLAVQAARRRLVLSFPRLDIGQGRPNIPSFFLLSCIEAVAGDTCDFDRLDRVIRETSMGRFVRLSRLDPDVRTWAVTPLEYDLASAAKARDEGTPDALAYLALESPFFANARTGETARYGTPRFTKYDGVIESRDLLREVAHLLLDPDLPLAPTILEDYASCPFKYLLKHVFALEPLKEPEQVPVISPLDRGSLVHGILCDFVKDAVASGHDTLAPDLWPRLLRTAERWFKRFPLSHVTGYPLTWELAREQILEDLRGFLAAEAAESGPFRPAHLEVAFGHGHGPHVTLDLGDGTVLRFRGRMDRVDLDRDRRRSRILDYKTGVVRKLADGEFKGGRALQLPLYLVAAAQLWPAYPPSCAAYCYVSRRSRFRRMEFTTRAWQDKLERLRLIVRTIYKQIRAGRFYPCGDAGQCEYCRGGAIPGEKPFDGFKWRVPDPMTREFKAMTEIP